MTTLQHLGSKGPGYLRRASFILLTLLIILPTDSYASTKQELLQEARDRDIANHPVWKRLLRYDDARQESDVLDDDFFLADSGSRDPKSELKETLKAYLQTIDDVASTSDVRCRFPGRYLWLNEKLGLPDYETTPEGCTTLELWLEPGRKRSINLLLVSSYMGNPASIFGHTLLTFSREQASARTDLLDTSINFGADVPEGEPTLLYILRGVFGGYEGRVMDAFYYNHDLSYLRLESRDVWEYTLNLSDFGTRLIKKHLWELANNAFTYYFFTKNCAYRIAETLELALPEEGLTDYLWTYIPVDLFHRLTDLDSTSENNLIGDVSFHPSDRTTLEATFQDLTPKGRAAAKSIIDNYAQNTEDATTDLKASEQLQVIDAALDYFQYQANSAYPDLNPDIERARKRLLKDRLRSPSSESPDRPAIENKPSPAESVPPRRLAGGLQITQKESPVAVLSWSPYSRKLDRVGGRQDQEMVALDVRATYDPYDRLTLTDIDFFKARSVNTSPFLIPGMHPWSWSLHSGYKRVDLQHETSHRIFLRGGIGLARSTEPGTRLSLELDTVAATEPAEVAAGPRLSMWHKTLSWAAIAEFGLLYGGEDRDVREHINMTLTRRLTGNISLKGRVALERALDKDRDPRAEIVATYSF